MPTNKEMEEVNTRVAQMKVILEEDLIKNKYNIEFIFGKVNSINCGIFATDYLQSHYAKWIGCTVLHFAVQEMNLEAVNILLSHGADFTIKNSSGSTALHQLVEDKPSLILKECNSDNSFINSVISAHVKCSNFENPVNANGLSHFHIACAVNNVEVVKGFLQNGISVDHAVRTDSPIFSGFTPLHFAAKNCALEVAKILLSQGADVQRKDTKGRLPVHIILEEKLANFNTICFNKTKIDKIDRLLELLLEKQNSDSIMTVDDWGLSDFHIACTFRESKIAASYLEKIADINHSVNMDSPLWPGYTALHFAAYCNIDLVKLLVKNGADITIKNTKRLTPHDICIKRYKAEDVYAIIYLFISWNPLWKNIVLSDGRTKLTDLVFAMRNPNQFNLFLKKIGKNFSICNSPSWSGCTPMHLAVIFAKGKPSADEEISMQILNDICKHNFRMLYSKDMHGQTPLHFAYRLNKDTVVGLLLEFLTSTVSIDCIDEEGLSFVHIAAAQNNIPLLKCMLSIGSDVNAAYKGNSLIPRSLYPGSTALHFAVVNGSVEAAEMLMKVGANVYAKDANDMTPIHLLLLDLEANILLSSPDLRDSVVRNIGLSHLHVVCWFCDQPKIVERLLDVGADINGVINYQPNTNSSSSKLSFMEKYDGYTPLQMAYDESNDYNAKALLKRGADIFARAAEGKALLYTILEESNANIFYDMFVETLTTRIDMQRRLIAETGMTDLHIACLDPRNVGTIEKLLNEGANVNAQIRDDSPIFKGYSPLHVVLYAAAHYEDYIIDGTIELLVKAGVDVTLRADNSETAVYVAWDLFKDESVDTAKPKYIRVNKLLEAQRDFSVNPANSAGFSHFHIACAVCNTGIVQQFLRAANVDIDQPIDFFDKHHPGYSGLHLAAGNPVQFCGVGNQLRMVDLLLNHGAKVHVEDVLGDTPLHQCAIFNCLDLFERLVRGGADMNARNILGNTPLYCYLKSKNASVEGLKLLLRFGCHLNVFNHITGEGYMGVAAWKFPPADLQSFLDAIIINFKQEMTADDLGRTIIHNIVSTSPPKVSATEYATFIGQLSETVCDVDSQDNLGQTALHVAVKFHNFKGLAGLLMAGADINIVDTDGKTAYACDFGSCSHCKSHDESTDESTDEEDEDEKLCEHIQIKKTLASHVKKLQYCGLDVNKQNEDFTCKAFEVYKIKTQWSEDFFEELEAMGNTTIGPYSLTLHDFMSESRAAADYPTMSFEKREAINKFFSSSERESLREKFPEASGILQLQYRKALARPYLVESAKNAMTLLIGFRLPEICSHFILILLTNSDLKSLISSISQ